jgi:phosphoribosylformimino-5-aminoimidazole carboxamide ribonucleotide (ProFAR) isomerase
VFEVIPAIDVFGGVLTAMTSTGTRSVSAFGGDPVAAAGSAVAAGARWIHVVDVDLAFDGVARNLDVLTEIASFPVSVQAAGGVREPSHVEALLAAGATRVVLGSAALSGERRASALISTEAERLVIGIEEDGGRIRSRGRAPVDLPLMETLGWVVSAGASALLVTSVDRVGDRAGPDLELVRRVVRAGRPVLAAGGIASLDDLRALRAAGAAGAVVGTAVLDGSLDLSAAIAELSGSEGTAV